MDDLLREKVGDREQECQPHPGLLAHGHSHILRQVQYRWSSRSRVSMSLTRLRHPIRTGSWRLIYYGPLAYSQHNEEGVALVRLLNEEGGGL